MEDNYKIKQEKEALKLIKPQKKEMAKEKKLKPVFKAKKKHKLPQVQEDKKSKKPRKTNTFHQAEDSENEDQDSCAKCGGLFKGGKHEKR